MTENVFQGICFTQKQKERLLLGRLIREAEASLPATTMKRFVISHCFIRLLLIMFVSLYHHYDDHFHS